MVLFALPADCNVSQNPEISLVRPLLTGICTTPTSSKPATFSRLSPFLCCSSSAVISSMALKSACKFKLSCVILRGIPCPSSAIKTAFGLFSILLVLFSEIPPSLFGTRPRFVIYSLVCFKRYDIWDTFIVSPTFPTKYELRKQKTGSIPYI